MPGHTADLAQFANAGIRGIQQQRLLHADSAEVFAAEGAMSTLYAMMCRALLL